MVTNGAAVRISSQSQRSSNVGQHANKQQLRATVFVHNCFSVWCGTLGAKRLRRQISGTPAWGRATSVAISRLPNPSRSLRPPKPPTAPISPSPSRSLIRLYVVHVVQIAPAIQVVQIVHQVVHVAQVPPCCSGSSHPSPGVRLRRFSHVFHSGHAQLRTTAGSPH